MEIKVGDSGLGKGWVKQLVAGVLDWDGNRQITERQLHQNLSISPNRAESSHNFGTGLRVSAPWAIDLLWEG